MPPVAQEFDCQAVMVPSLVGRDFDIARSRRGDCRQSSTRWRGRETSSPGLPPAGFGKQPGFTPQRSAANLLPNPPPMYCISTCDVGGGTLRAICPDRRRYPKHSAWRAIDSLECQLNLHDIAVRLQAAVRDYRNAVGSFDGRVGLLESLVGIAGHLLAGGLGALAGLGRSSSLTRCGRTSYLILILRTASLAISSVTAATAAISVAFPLHFLPAGSDHAHGFDALHVLRRAGIDAGNAGVGVRRGEQGAE